MRSNDEVYVKAIAGRVVPPRDGAGTMVVTVEHCVAANIAMNSVDGSCPEMTTVIREA
jgi:hypothetical protein